MSDLVDETRVEEAEASKMQGEKKRKLGQRVLNLYETAAGAAEELNDHRRDWYRWWRGRQWKKLERPSWLATPVANIMVPAVENIVGMLTDNVPKFQVKTERFQNAQAAELWNHRIMFWWVKEDMPRVCADWVKNAVVYGAGILGLSVRHKDGQPQLVPTCIDPLTFLLDPSAESLKKAKYVLYANWVHVDDIEEIYGERLKSEDGMKEDFRRELPAVDVKDRLTFGGGGSPLGEFRRTSGGQVTREDQVFVIECWWDDATYITIPLKERQEEAVLENENMETEAVEVSPMQDHATHGEIHGLGLEALQNAVLDSMNMEGDPAEIQQNILLLERLKGHQAQHQEYLDRGYKYKAKRRKYPKGRFTVITETGYVLHDSPNPYGFKPFVMYNFNDLPNEPVGMSTVDLLIPTQKEINHLIAKALDGANLAATPPMVWSEHSGFNPEKAKIKPRAKWKITSMTEKPEFLDVRPIPFDKVQKFVDHLMFIADILSGTHDVMQGRMPRGAQTSGRAIGRLQEAGFKRLSQPIASLHSSLIDLGAMVIKIMQEMFDSPEDFPKHGAPYAELAQNEENYVTDFRGTDYRDVRFMVEVVTNSMLPVDKLRVREDALALHQKAVIDDEALVEALEFPDGVRVVQRMKERLMAAGAQPIENRRGQGVPPLPTS